jgi:hypothetical protein
MYLLRRLVCQRLMRASFVVEANVVGNASFRFLERGIFLEVHFLILHAAPEPFGEDVVMVGAFAVHADTDAECGQHIGEGLGSELAALVAVEYIRCPMQQRRLQCLDAEAAFDRGRQPPNVSRSFGWSCASGPGFAVRRLPPPFPSSIVFLTDAPCMP